MKYLSQIEIAPKGGFRGFGKLGLETDDPGTADLIFKNFIDSAIGLIGLIAIIWFVFLVATGGYGFMTAGGDKNAIESSKKKLVNGLIGLLVTLLGIFVIRFIGYLLGFEEILNFPLLFARITGLIKN